jgi:DNA-binding NtrC family response regulator
MSSSRYLILHLEDDVSLKETVGELLSAVEPDSEVHQFTNSDDAISFIDQNGGKIDLFLLDVRVPGKTDGIGVAKHVVENGNTGSIVFMSAFQKPALGEMGDMKYEWVNKPWAVEKLLEVLERAKSSGM